MFKDDTLLFPQSSNETRHAFKLHTKISIIGGGKHAHVVYETLLLTDHQVEGVITPTEADNTLPVDWLGEQMSLAGCSGKGPISPPSR